MNRIRLEIEIPYGHEETRRIQDHLQAVLDNYGVRYEITPFTYTMIGVDQGMHSHSYRYEGSVAGMAAPEEINVLQGNHSHYSPRMLEEIKEKFLATLPPPPEDFIEEKEMEI